MEKRKKRPGRHKGSSLMFVIIAIAFVGILATIVLHATLVNVQVKSQDKLIKKDFYSAEGVMEMVEQGIQNMALDCMAKAYTEMMEKYATNATTTSNQDELQKEFAKSYMDKLVTKLTGTGISEISGEYVLDNSMYSRNKIYSEYEKIVNSVDSAYIPNKAKYLDFYKHGDWDSSVEKDSVKPMLQLSFSATNPNAEKSLVIKNVQVIYTDDTAGADVDHKRSSEITTDIKLVVPRLSFASSSIYPEFTKYAIIGDDQVTSTLAGSNENVNVNVNGYVYAGHNGLFVDKGNVKIAGNGIRVISRGDISVRQGGSLQLGEPGTADTEPVLAEVWTENYKTRLTTGSTSTKKAKLNVYAESYVHDDLALDSPYSRVNFGAGNYYGYSFNKNNITGSHTTVDSEYSSAIMINGKHSSLSMSDNLKSILLGGRAFISRSRESSHATDDGRTTDIPMGQAVSIKCDQNFYKIANDDMAAGFTNPMDGNSYEAAKVAGQRTKYSVYGGDYETVLSESKRAEYYDYLVPEQPVTEIHYSLSNTNSTAEMVYFYYNFRSEAKADEFFNDVIYDRDKFYDKIKSSEYLSFGGSPSGLELAISTNLLAWTNSNFIQKIDNSGMEVGRKTIDAADMQTYLNTSIQYASLYKSYQLTLTDGLASQFAQDAGTQGSDAFDLEKTELTGSGLDPDDRKVKNTNQLFGNKLITKENNSDEYKFVKEAATDPTTYGFTAIGSNGSNLYLKAVKVPMATSSSTNQVVNGFAVFVACTDPDPSQSNVNMSTIQDNLQHDLGFSNSNADPYNRVLMVVSNCNVTVDRDVRGLVISDTVVKLYGTSVDMTADSASLQAMITAQKKLEGSSPESGKFLKYFQCFANFEFGSDEDVENVVDISQYTSYQNWRKNDDTYE